MDSEKRPSRWRTVQIIGIIILTAALILGLHPGMLYDVRAKEEEERLRIVFIHNNPCASCNEVGKFSETVREQFGEEGVPFHYDIIGYYAYSTEGAEKVKELKEEFGIADKDMYYPMAVINDRYLLGSTAVGDGIKALMMEEAGFEEDSSESEGITEGAGEQISELTGMSEEAGERISESVGAEKGSEAQISESAGTEKGSEARISESAGIAEGTEDGGSGYETSESADVPDGGQDMTERTSKAADADIIVHYYDTTACESCAKADAAVEEIPDSVTINGKEYTVAVEIKSVAEGDNASELTGYFERYGVPSSRQKVPILFVGSRYLCDDEIVKELDNILSSNEALEPEPESKASDENRAENENFLDAVGIGSIIATGFLNGLNPCSLSMTLLFLSLLVGRKKFLRYGLAFLAGKYVAYVALGIAVTKAAAVIPAAAFGIASTVINVILLVLCLILCVGNFLDFLNARKGEYGKIRVQLPVALRRWNHKFIKQTVNDGKGEKFLLPTVFIGSVVVSLGEFFCTGQIYLASILSWIERAEGSGVPIAVFCIYIAMLCVPALIIVVMLAFGKSVLSISDQARKQMPAVKLLNALFFAVFAALAVKMLLG